MALALRPVLLACLACFASLAAAACSSPRSSSRAGLETVDAGSGSGAPDAGAGADADAGADAGADAPGDALACDAQPPPAQPPPAPPAYATCTMNLDANRIACENACIAAHPDDPNPDPATCPNGYSGSSFLARMRCWAQCQVTSHDAWFGCCTTAGVGGKPIDLGGTSAEAADCNLQACWGNVHRDYHGCLTNYGGYTGHDHHGDPCKIDAFGYCDAIFNGGYDICVASWRTPLCGTTACGVALPCGLDDWIADLGDDVFAVREAAHARILGELRDRIRGNPGDMQCVINLIRGRFLNHPDVTDPEVAARLRSIWGDLVHTAPGGPIPPGCPASP